MIQSNSLLPKREYCEIIQLMKLKKQEWKDMGESTRLRFAVIADMLKKKATISSI
jgi:hypothetical protein